LKTLNETLYVHVFLIVHCQSFTYVVDAVFHESDQEFACIVQATTFQAYLASCAGSTNLFVADHAFASAFVAFRLLGKIFLFAQALASYSITKSVVISHTVSSVVQFISSTGIDAS